ncbi:MAG: hypothetical protein ACTSYA_11085 [Candidatus Kariarchaeaceae archaeon]
MVKKTSEKYPDICYLPRIEMPFFDARIPIIIPLFIIFVVLAVIFTFFSQFLRFFVEAPSTIKGYFKKSDKHKEFDQRITAMRSKGTKKQFTSNSINQSSNPNDDKRPIIGQKTFCSTCGSEKTQKGAFCSNCGAQSD